MDTPRPSPRTNRTRCVFGKNPQSAASKGHVPLRDPALAGRATSGAATSEAEVDGFVLARATFEQVGASCSKVWEGSRLLDREVEPELLARVGGGEEKLVRGTAPRDGQCVRLRARSALALLRNSALA